MTEKKRYYRTYVNLVYNNHEPYYNIRDRKKGGNNVLFMVGGKHTSKEIVDRLNEQEETINNLKKALWESEMSYIEEKNEYSIDVERDIDWLKKEFEREYWNGDVDD